MNFTYCDRCRQQVIKGICGCTTPTVTHHCPGCERLRAELLACCELHERSMMIIEEALGPDRPNGGTWRAQQIANEIIALRNFIAMDKEATTGERIRQMRLARGMTQDQLSSAAGISKGFLSDVENGKRDISSRNLLRIATALSASVDYLLQGVFCPGCEAAAREVADIAAVLRTGSSGDTLLGKEVSQWIDTAHAVEAERDDLRARLEAVENIAFAVGAMDYYPCFVCGYNGENYYQPSAHPCAARHHKYRDCINLAQAELRALLAQPGARQEEGEEA